MYSSLKPRSCTLMGVWSWRSREISRKADTRRLRTKANTSTHIYHWDPLQVSVSCPWPESADERIFLISHCHNNYEIYEKGHKPLKPRVDWFRITSLLNVFRPRGGWFWSPDESLSRSTVLLTTTTTHCGLAQQSIVGIKELQSPESLSLATISITNTKG